MKPDCVGRERPTSFFLFLKSGIPMNGMRVGTGYVFYSLTNMEVC